MMQKKKQILQLRKLMEERLLMSDQDLLMSDVHILKFHTCKGVLQLLLSLLLLLLLLLLFLLLLLQEPTDIPSRKKLMRCVCARGWCVRRGSLIIL